MVGEESYASRLAPLLDSLQDHWTFLGLLSPVEMSAFFHECDLTVLPSINSTESYGLVQVELMTCGTPVIASDLPGVRVPIDLTGMGLVVPARDSKALSEAIMEILSEPDRYRPVIPDIIEQSTPSSVAAAYEKAFLLAQSRVRSVKTNNRNEQINNHDKEAGAVQKDPMGQDITPPVGQVSKPAGLLSKQRNPTYKFIDSPRLKETAIILAGGMGTRLRPILADVPKALAPAAGKPFLYYVLSYLEGQGIKKVVLALGYRAEQVLVYIRQHQEGGSPWDMEITSSIEKQPLGTAGAVKLALESAPVDAGESFFVVNGDTLFTVDFRNMMETYHQRKGTATIALLETVDNKSRGNVQLDEGGWVRSFIEKPDEGGRALVNGGVYLLKPAALESIDPGQPASLEAQIFPTLAEQGTLAGCIQDAYFIDIGTPASLEVIRR